MKNRHFLVVAILWLQFSPVNSVTAQNWNGFRGSQGIGQVQTINGVLKTQSDVNLQTRWKRKLGSGYSSVVVSGTDLITMYTDGNHDIVICMDAKDGSTRWETKTGPMFPGLNGSFDGPLSTPLIYESKVYAMSATGTLFCLDIDDGEIIWTYDLVEQDQAVRPLYGFVTSPILSGSVIVVQTGVKNKSVYGFNATSGEIVWTAGDDRIDSQTPVRISIENQDLILASGGKNLLGIDPSDGKILFSIEHNGGNGTAVSPVPIGNDRFLLTIDDQYSKAFTVRQVGDGQLVASEDWQTRSIKNTYNVPVLSGDGVFAFSTRILTCVDPATGKALWKSRKPGDGFLIAVDGHLIITTKTGSIHLATASVEGYREKSKLKLFADLVWSIPAYHDDSIFVRSMEEIARVDLVGKPKIAINNKLSLPMGNQFAEFLAEVKSLKTPAEKTKKINDWIQSKTSFPWIENDVAHFVYRGQPNDIALAGDFFGSRQEKSMIPVEGTDLFYYTVRLPLDQRANYCFLINYKPVADPLNPNQTTSSLYAGEMEFAIRLAGQPLLKMSSFAMPQWDGPDYLRDVANQLSGTVEDLILESKPDSEEPDNQEEADSEPATNPTKLKVYLPPNYAKNLNQRFPVAYIFDAKGAQQFGQMLSLVDNHFDRLIQQDSSIIPPILVLMDGLKPDFSNQIATEVVPFVDRNYRTRADRESRMIFGCGFYAGSSIITSLSENQTFGIAASQSPLAFAAERDMISKLVPKVDQATKVHLQWGRLDMFNPHENWDVRTMSQAVVQNLQSNDQIEVVGGPVNDSTDWSSWKNRYDEIFGLLIKF